MLARSCCRRARSCLPARARTTPKPTEDLNVRNTILAFAIATTMLAASGSAFAQRGSADAAKKPSAPTPRLADGTVDLGGDGIWDQPCITDFGKQPAGDREIPSLPMTKATYDHH